MTDNNQRKEAKEEVWVHEFSEEAAQKFREHLMTQAHEVPSANHPLIVYIDSFGGSADACITMIETMDEIANPIYTVCLGKAMSAGAILLSHGDQRFCGQHSRIMIHEGCSCTGGNVHNMLNDVKESQRLNRYILGLLAKNCGIKGGYSAMRKIMKNHDGDELWLDAHAAKKFGIIDHIGVPHVEAAIMYVTSAHRRQK